MWKTLFRTLKEFPAAPERFSSFRIDVGGDENFATRFSPASVLNNHARNPRGDYFFGEVIMAAASVPTENDLNTLGRAHYLKHQHGAYIYPTGPGQFSHFRRLCKVGWLKDTRSYGHDIDGRRDADVRLFELTHDGEQILRERRLI
jgi:hypothetical protein